MPFDPFVKRFLDRMLAEHPVKFWHMPVAAARLAFTSLALMVGAKSRPVAAVEDRLFPGPGGDVAVRLYVPNGAGAVSPGLVFFHGGGFVLGNLEIYDGFCRKLADASAMRVVSVDYRLAPEHKFPAGVEDACAALNWMGAHAADFGLDPGKIAVGGDSAGGNLAAVACQRAALAGLAVTGQLLIAPLTHVSEDYPSMRAVQNDLILSREAALWFMDQYLNSPAEYDDPRVSPLLADGLIGLPPAYFLLGGADPLHDCAAAYAEKLKAAGVSVTVADYPGMMHDFVFLQSLLPQAAPALEAAAGWLRGLA